MFHFTGNQPDGAGFDVCAGQIARAAQGRRIWVKGHGTGTLEAGRIEAEALARHFPGAPLVSWKGSLGHTLGSCGLVELAIARAAIASPVQTIPGTVGTTGPCFTDTVALRPFSAGSFEGAVLASNAFGGAHAAMLLTHD
jgi:3-oxoacyl-(acyl-carrier-protein) synthase